MKTQRLYVTELVGLDLLRFILAVAIVIRHYYFFYYGHVELDQIVESQPFFSVIGILYKWGGEAVQAFWLISGLIFYSIYHDEIIKKEVSFKEFVFFRFSRLYPLHFLTLLVVAVLQVWYSVVHGEFFVAQAQDIKHFVHQILFINAWFPSFEHSFNIPVWSVSVEILVYIIFFFLAAAGVLRNRGIFVVASLMVLFYMVDAFAPFSRCASFFFFGCMLAKVLGETQKPWTLLVKFIAAFALMGILFRVVKYLNPTLSDEGYGLLVNLTLLPFASVIVLGFILAFRRLQAVRFVRLFKNLGNLTYSLYLVHMPIILTIVLVLDPEGTSIYDNPLMLIAFIGISIVTGWLVFTYFEKPVQKYLRRKFDAQQLEKAHTKYGENADVAA